MVLEAFSLAAFSLVGLALTVGVVTACSVVAFCAGMLFERWSSASLLKKTASDFKKTVQQTLLQLKKAQEACTQLESFSKPVDSETEQALEKRRSGLFASLGRLIQFSSSEPKAGVKEVELKTESNTTEEAPKASGKTKAVVLKWVDAPVDSRTLLPDQVAFQENLHNMAQAISAELEAGLLLVQVDRFDSLLQRYGLEQQNHLLQSLAKLLVHLVDEGDVVCHCTAGLFTVLMRDQSAASSLAKADTIRKSIRNHRFRLSNMGREVLMTASYGFYAPTPGDHHDLIFNRAIASLAGARRRGRNQLYLHNGMMVQAFESAKSTATH